MVLETASRYLTSAWKPVEFPVALVADESNGWKRRGIARLQIDRKCHFSSWYILVSGALGGNHFVSRIGNIDHLGAMLATVAEAIESRSILEMFCSCMTLPSSL